MQKTLLTALQCISEIIQFNREHKQVQNEKSLCTRKDVCAVYTFVCTVCVAVEKHIREYINLTFYFFVETNEWMDVWTVELLGTWYLSVRSPLLGLHVNSLSIKNKTSIKLLIKG